MNKPKGTLVASYNVLPFEIKSHMCNTGCDSWYINWNYSDYVCIGITYVSDYFIFGDTITASFLKSDIHVVRHVRALIGCEQHCQSCIELNVEEAKQLQKKLKNCRKCRKIKLYIKNLWQKMKVVHHTCQLGQSPCLPVLHLLDRDPGKSRLSSQVRQLPPLAVLETTSPAQMAQHTDEATRVS